MQNPHGPWLTDHPTRSWPLHSKAATGAAESAGLALQQQPHALMAQAGLAVAQLALAKTPHSRHTWVAVGPGNNGGDGLVAALHLRRAGLEVTACLVGETSTRPDDAAWALQAAQAAGVRLQTGLPTSWSPCDSSGLVIDALLGMGASRVPQGAIAQAIQHINDGPAPVLAVDLPSGLDADTGCGWDSSATISGGSLVVRAHTTLSLLTLKPGLFTALGRDLAGQVWLHTLGVDAGAATATLHVPAPAHARLHASNKGSHGDVAVVAGAPGMTGAAWLAARASLAAGAGRVYVSLLDDGPATTDPLHPELMQRGRWWLSAANVLARHTVICGCGGGEPVAGALPPLLAHAARLVLDADALNALSRDTALAQQLQKRAARGLPTVLTPHPLEAARLLGLGAAQVQRDRLGAAQALANRFQCTVLLKGSGTVIAAPDALPLLNPTGNAALAGPGTGDVLAGWLAGLWAQQADGNVQEVAACAAWQHGHAADRFAGAAYGKPLRASALIEALATQV